jgi:hypothetical protein
MDFEECFIALRMISVRYPLKNSLEWHIDVRALHLEAQHCLQEQTSGAVAGEVR